MVGPGEVGRTGGGVGALVGGGLGGALGTGEVPRDAGVSSASPRPPQATRNTGKSIANRNIANPTAALLAACMMLDHLRWAGPQPRGVA